MIYSWHEWSQGKSINVSKLNTYLVRAKIYQQLSVDSTRTHTNKYLFITTVSYCSHLGDILYIWRCRRTQRVCRMEKSYAHDKTNKIVKRILHITFRRNDFNQHPDIWCPASEKKTYRKYIAVDWFRCRKEISGDKRDATFDIAILRTSPHTTTLLDIYEFNIRVCFIS